ncbi:ankyrin repeat-containing domain protein [Baffinella frigidus]|nr:ankyrin repeat-containing domain protein [Cryptophyta sp. CCMP2293]
MAVIHKKVSAFHTACGAGDMDTVNLYLSGSKSDFLGGKRVMPFHLAPGGLSALSLAATGGHTVVLEALLNVKVPANSRADINGASNSGDTALMAAAAAGMPDAVALLLTRGADFGSVDELGNRLGAEVGSVNELGDTALHCAARITVHVNPRAAVMAERGWQHCCCRQLRAAAASSCRQQGFTGTDVATRSAVMATLAAAGVDGNVANKKGLTAAQVMANPGAMAAEEDAPLEESPAPATVEQYYTDATGRKMKKVLSLEDATWDVMGKRVLSGKEQFEGKQTSRDRTVKRQVAKQKKLTEAEEAEYILQTGDTAGYQGFVKVGEREESEEEKMGARLREMGYHQDTAAAAGA